MKFIKKIKIISNESNKWALPCLHKCFSLSTFNQIPIKYSYNVCCNKYQYNTPKFTLPIGPEFERSVTYNKMKNFSKDEFLEIMICLGFRSRVRSWVKVNVAKGPKCTLMHETGRPKKA